MRICISMLALLALAGLIWADELDDAYAALKEAQGSNNVDDILKWAPEAAKLAKAEAARKQPDNMKAEDWKARVEFANQVTTFAEYSLSAGAQAPSSDLNKTVALVDGLLALNPKSQYLGAAVPAYLTALEKAGGAAKQMDGANKILNGNPNNEDALYAVMSGSYGKNNERAEQFATRLINAMRTKAKPEGVSDADWNRKKDAMLGYAYYYAGLIPGTSQRPSYPDCDKNFRAGMSYITKQPGLGGTALFYLGLCNYKIAQLTNDKAKLQEALKFTEEAINAGGPMAGQAQQNATVMRRELGVGAAPAKSTATKAPATTAPATKAPAKGK